MPNNLFCPCEYCRERRPGRDGASFVIPGAIIAAIAFILIFLYLEILSR